MKTLTIDNKTYSASERIYNIVHQYANEPRILAIVKEAGIVTEELIEVK